MLIMSGCSKQEIYYSDVEFSHMDFSEMTYYKDDYVAKFDETIDKIRTMADENQDESAIKAEFENLRNIYADLQNDYNLTYIHMSINNSEEKIQKNKTASDNIALADESFDNLIVDLGKLGCYDLISYFTGEEFAKEDLEDKPTDKLYELQNRETELMAQYQRIAENMINSNDTTVGELFKELVDVRNEIAKERGYSDYAEYAYDEIYGRDYTTADAEKLHNNIKKILAPVSSELGSEVAMNTHGEGYHTVDEVMAFLAECTGEISPELKTSYDYMINNHLYDIEQSETKMMRNAYTINLGKYNSPFVFLYYPSVGTMVHEFGHFNHMLYCDDDGKSNKDLAEIHSQGLELLCTEYYDSIYKERAHVMRMYTVSNILSVIVQGCMVDEWEIAVYKNPDMTVQEYDELFVKLTEEYCLEGIGSHEWVKISHPFLSPMYMISYSTSGIASMEIWEMSQKNRDKAIDRYMKLTASDTADGFENVLDRCGLSGVFSNRTLKGIAKTIEKEFLSEK